MKKVFLFAAMAILALVGCEKQNQSELNFEDVQKEATVKGTLVAYVNAPGAATQTLALEGVRVYVEVAANQYTDKAEGANKFEAKTDAEGKFEIKVKTGAKSIKGALLKIDDFSYDVNGKTVYYTFDDVNLGDLTADGLENNYLVAKEDAVLNQTVGTAKLMGVLTYDAGTVKQADGTLEEHTHAYAANVDVIAAVTYFAGKPEEVVKKFVVKTDSKGAYSFDIPVETDGNDLELSIAQFKANYTEFANNQWTTSEYFYTLSAPVPATVNANETKIVDFAADTKEAIEPTTKNQIAFNVKGVMSKEFEKPEYDKSDNLTGYSKGLQPTSDYKITIRLDYYDDAHSEILSTILYEGITPGDKGAVNQQVKLYDGWNIANVKVSAYADKTIKVTANEFYHYYLALDADTKKYATVKDGYTKQKDLQGIYKGGPDNLLCTAKWADDKQLFFDLDLGDLVLKFEPESKSTLIGIAFDANPGEPAKLCDGTDSKYYFHNTKIDDKVYALGIGGIAW